MARLAGVTDDVTVVTDRRYERLVRAQLPGVAMLLEPLGRNTAAAIALAALAIDRPDDDVMLVLPADQTVEQPGRFGDVLREAADGLAHGRLRHRGSARDARDPGRPAGDRVRLPDPGRRARRADRRAPGLSAATVRGEAEARSRPRS